MSYFCLTKDRVCVSHPADEPLVDGEVCYDDVQACEQAIVERTQVVCLGRETILGPAGDARHACQQGSLDMCMNGKDTPTFASLEDCWAQWPEGAPAAAKGGARERHATSRCLGATPHGPGRDAWRSVSEELRI
ncbi:MAG: hypothetical protein EBZ50_13285 [Alphaproteobacteria bacterium]|jgi:hypothetical protein|nr:hypothetical protein [Alphaproteobacteria bacterium]